MLSQYFKTSLIIVLILGCVCLLFASTPEWIGINSETEILSLSAGNSFLAENHNKGMQKAYVYSSYQEEDKEMAKEELLALYQSSLGVWNSLSSQYSNSYTYTTGFGSVFGFGSRTTIYVEDGTVIGRDYYAYKIDHSTGEKRITEQWTEEEDQIGNHSQGSQPVTYDALYEECSGILNNTDLDHNDVWFESNPEQIMLQCGYYPHGCRDDCSRGIHVMEFEFID